MSAEVEIERYLRDNKDSWFPAAALCRMEFRNDDKTTAAPKSVSRRLQEMQEESVIAVRYVGVKRTSEYRWIPYHLRARYIPSSLQGVNGSWRPETPPVASKTAVLATLPPRYEKPTTKALFA